MLLLSLVSPPSPHLGLVLMFCATDTRCHRRCSVDIGDSIHHITHQGATDLPHRHAGHLRHNDECCYLPGRHWARPLHRSEF